MASVTTNLVAERFKALVPIANPSGKEQVIREHIQSLLAQWGEFEQVVDGAGNLVVRIPGKSECHPILLSAHMDSVPPCEGIEPVDDVDETSGRPVIRSAGKTILGADDKSGIAVMVNVVEALAKEGFTNNHPLELFFSVEEEVGLLGSKVFDFSTVQSPYGYVLDGEGAVGDIFNAGSTQRHYKIHCHGRPAHAGIAPDKGMSAIQMVAQLIEKLPQGRLSEQTTTNIGTIDGGCAINVVAEHASLRAEVRSRSDEELQDLVNQVEEACASVRNDWPEATITLEWIDRYPRFEVPEGAPVIKWVQQVFETHQIPSTIRPMSIGSDAHWLNAHNVDTVVLGMGFYQSHSLGEYIFPDELEQVFHVVMDLLRPAS